MQTEYASKYAKLCEAIEKTIGKKMMTPKDFDDLAIDIYKHTSLRVSATTLRRMWGYQEQDKRVTPREYTLNLLSQYVGYMSWEAFASESTKTESGPLNNRCIYSTILKPGEELRLVWNPDRSIIIRFMGQDVFEVIESNNSKLKPGNRFSCGCFIDGEPCHLHRLIDDTGNVTNYVCGSENGIKFFKHK